MRWGLPLLLKQQAPGAGLFLLVSNWVGGVSSMSETLSQHNPEAKGNKWGVGLFTQQRRWLPRWH